MERGLALAVKPGSNLYVAGSLHTSSSYEIVTLKYSGPPAPLIFVTTGGSLGLSNNQFTFTVSGPPGSSIIISESSDLLSRVALVTNQLSGGTLRYTNTVAPGTLRPFFRAMAN